MKPAMAHALSAADLERFVAKVAYVPDGCWEWQGSRLPKGYGTWQVAGRTVYAHRLMHEVVAGPIPDGWWVCHRGDNPPCVRPDHPFLGTPADNSADMTAKGRHWLTANPERSVEFCSERNPSAKLTAEQVGDIRARYAAGGVYQRELGEEYGVTQRLVSQIVLGQAWRHSA